MRLIDIYQSKIFGKRIPKEVADFCNVHYTEAVSNDIGKSVMAMRNQMFSENETKCAVFIGGMKGILDEYEMLEKRYPQADFYAFASTGGAAVDLYKRIGDKIPLLANSYAYMSIFRELLSKYKKYYK